MFANIRKLFVGLQPVQKSHPRVSPEFRRAELPLRRPELPQNDFNLPPGGGNAADMMRQMRLRMLTTSPNDFSQKPTAEFPRVFGVVMDWGLEANIITVVALSTGDAGIYSTGTFGVIGGIEHVTVRTAARNCVKIAERFYDAARLTKEYPYPASGRMLFYLVCYDQVRVIDAGLEAGRIGRDNCSDLFEAVERVITELRIITQKQKGEIP